MLQHVALFVRAAPLVGLCALCLFYINNITSIVVVTFSSHRPRLRKASKDHVKRFKDGPPSVSRTPFLTSLSHLTLPLSCFTERKNYKEARKDLMKVFLVVLQVVRDGARVQCAGHGFAGSVVGRSLQFLRTTLHHQDGPHVGRSGTAQPHITLIFCWSWTTTELCCHSKST